MEWDDLGVAGHPDGTVTLLLADIEGSTRLWEERGSEMPEALAGLDTCVDELVARHAGFRPVEQGEGDSFVAAFPLATDAVACALELQLASLDGLLRLRIGLHTGEIQQRSEGFYIGSTINRTARIRDAGHGGQVLVSQTTSDLVQDRLPEGCSLVDLGPCRLRDLGRPVHLWQLSHPALRSTFPPLRGLDVGPNNLPIQLTSFVGRAEAVAQLHGILDVERAVTLTGAGGCGKTRLAIHVAAERAELYPGGVWLVDLAPVNDAAAVGMVVADAVGAPLQPGQPAVSAITAAVGTAPTLLVLDNCEHVVAECAALVESLLRSCRGALVIATSREPLGISGEVTFRVPSLAVPDPQHRTLASLQQFDAAALFLDRAHRAARHSVVDDASAPVFGEICRRLDGIPLAIELAAARLRVLTPEQILTGLQDRFRLLTGGARTAVPRHQTLQASVDWSYNLLLTPERLLLQRLSVLAGPFTLEAAEAVGSGGELEPHHIFDLLLQLVDKSLLASDERATAGRYSMLETVRQYAAGRLVDAGDANEVRSRHFEFFLAFAGQRQETTDEYRRRIDPDYDNLRRALQWADDQDDPEALVRLAARLYGYWALGRRPGEGHEWLRRATERARATELRGRVLGHFAHIHGMTVSWAAAIPLAEEAVELARARGSRRLPWALAQLANALSNVWRMDEADAALREAIAISEAGGDVHGQAFALFQLGRMSSVLDPEAALIALDGAARLAAAIGAEYIEHMSKACIAWSWAELRDLRRAASTVTTALDGLRTIGDGWFFASILAFAAHVRSVAGDDVGASQALEELAGLRTEIGPAVRSAALLGPGLVAVIRGDWCEAVALLTQVEGFDRDASLPALIIAQVHARQIASAQSTMTEAASRAPEGYGRAVPLARAELALAGGHPDRAQQFAREFLLAPGTLLMKPIFEIRALQLCASATGQLGRHDDAARLFGAAAAQAERIGMSMSTPFARLGSPYLEETGRVLGPDGLDDRWQEGAAMSWDELIAYIGRGRGARRRPRSGWNSLTGTERQVVDLVAQGLTNKAVAERLVMSVPTVKSHLTHAYAKVGVSSRAELIAQREQDPADHR